MDDILQDAFLQVFQSLRGWRAEASLGTWIDRVAVRSAYRYLSTKGRRVQTTSLVDDDLAGASDDAPGARRQLARDGVRRLYAVLDKLSPAARLAFTLHEIDGRSLAETAQLVGSSVTATKLRVWRARKKIEEAAAADPVLRVFLAPSVSGQFAAVDEAIAIAEPPKVEHQQIAVPIVPVAPVASAAPAAPVPIAIPTKDAISRPVPMPASAQAAALAAQSLGARASQVIPVVAPPIPNSVPITPMAPLAPSAAGAAMPPPPPPRTITGAVPTITVGPPPPPRTITGAVPTLPIAKIAMPPAPPATPRPPPPPVVIPIGKTGPVAAAAAAAATVPIPAAVVDRITAAISAALDDAESDEALAVDAEAAGAHPSHSDRGLPPITDDDLLEEL